LQHFLKKENECKNYFWTTINFNIAIFSSSYLFMSPHEMETLKPYHPLELKLESLRLKKSLVLPA
jgi:hypothetical protein